MQMIRNNIEATEMASSVIERVALKSAVSAVLAVVEKRNTIPVLDQIRFEANGDILRLIGTDQDIEVTAEITGQAVDARTNFNVNGHKLEKLLNSAPAAGSIAIEAVTPQKTKFEFGAKAVYQLPSIEIETDVLDHIRAKASTGQLFTIAGGDLKTTLERVKGAISTEETRYYLNGVFWHDMGAEHAIVATDGHRLYRQMMERPEGFTDIMTLESTNHKTGEVTAPFKVDGVIIPAKTVHLLLKLFGKKAPVEIDIRIDAERMEFSFPFEFGTIIVRSKTIDGTYPDYQRVIPQHNGKHAIVGREEMLEALKATTFVFSSRNRGAYLSFGDSDFIRCSDTDGGIAQYTLNPEVNFTDHFEIGLNADSFKDIVQGLGAEIDMAFDEASSPVLMTSPGMRGFTAVQMPMRV